MTEETTLNALRLNVKLERETIIKMAIAAGFAHAPPKFRHWRGTISDLERFAELVMDVSIQERSNVQGEALPTATQETKL